MVQKGGYGRFYRGLEWFSCSWAVEHGASHLFARTMVERTEGDDQAFLC